MYVHSIHLENVRGFTDLHFDLQRPDGEYAGWTVFVGGNSSGKSTILRATALALMGPDSGGRLQGSPAGWIQSGHSKATANLEVKWDKKHDSFRRKGTSPGEIFDVGVKWAAERTADGLAQGEIPIFSALSKRTKKQGRIITPERGPWSPNAAGWFSAGYGPMRRLTGSSSEAMRFSVSKEIESRFATLFREDAALSESEEWLRRMYARGLESNSVEISHVLDSVRRLLGDELLPHGLKISKITVDHVYVTDGKIQLPMRDISDGCRSMYATILDLVHGMFEVYGADLFDEDSDGRCIITRPGVVIIDEIEAHLHPSWQRDIPEWLKRHFPKIQFLVSTHSPLVAQSADPNGLFILPIALDQGAIARPASEREYERIRWGNAQKTILGSAFGLKTTRTQWANRQISRWQMLSSKKQAGKLSREEMRQYKELDKQIELAFDGAPTETVLEK